MKKLTLNGEEVKILRDIVLNVPQAGKYTFKKVPVVDKHGSWVQVEMLTGPEKGTHRPVVRESLK